jgi:rhamnosyltransferase
MRNRIGIFIIEDSKNIDDCLIFSLLEFSKAVNELFVWAKSRELCEALQEETADFPGNIIVNQYRNTQEIFQRIGFDKLEAFDELLISNDNYYGPFYAWSEVMEDMAEGFYDFWTAIQENTDTRNLLSNSSFIVMQRKLLTSQCFKEYINQDIDASSNFVAYFIENGFRYGVYLSDIYQKYTGSYDLAVYRCGELIEHNVPILCKRAIRKKDYDISFSGQVQEAMKIIEKHYDFNTDMIIRDLIKSVNMRILFDNFPWNYVLPTEQVNNINRMSSNKTAVIICLYYEKCLRKNLSYLKNVPGYLGKFIVAKRPELVPQIKSIMEEEALNAEIIIAAENRGRDLSALLIEGRRLFDEYEYICFVHDKQTSGAADADIVGDEFNHLIFENMLGSTPYIEQVLNLFEENPFLGLLSPPEVLHGGYFSIIGNEWTNNYENTVQLADTLKIDAPIEIKQPPYALSTTFWCRTKALKKLISYQWKYNDFPDEPLEMDGTLNHAIERILMYVAQDAGYYTGIVQTTDFATRYLTCFKRMLDDALGVCHKKVFFNKHTDLMNDTSSQLLDFCRREGILYIYGAGGNASRLADFFDSQGIPFAGYIVTDGYRKKMYQGDKNIYQLSEIDLAEQNIKIVISVNKKLQKDIVRRFEENAFTRYYCL